MELLTPLAFAALSLGLAIAFVGAAQPIVGLVLLVPIAVVIDYASHNLILMAIADAVLLGMLILAILREKRMTMPGEPVRLKTDGDRYFSLFTVLGVVYLVIGLVRGNDSIFALGDFFHIVLEMGVPFFLCTVFLRSENRMLKFCSVLGRVMLILSVVIILLYVTGALQKLEGAGAFYRHSSMWRVRVNAHYPFFPLVWLLAIWFFQPSEQGRRTTGLAVIALSIIVILTLKRTLWIGLVLILIYYFMSVGHRQRLRGVATAMGVAALAFIAGALLLPRQLFDTQELEVYRHSVERRFSSEDSDIDLSVENRIAQFSDTMEELAANPLGYGLGYEANVRFIARGTKRPTHYIHNAFLHYWLQVGIWYPLALVFLTISVIRRGRQVYQRLPDGTLKGAVLGATGCYIAIIIASTTEIGTNTFFLPFSAAFIYIADLISREGGPAGVRDRHALLHNIDPQRT